MYQSGAYVIYGIQGVCRIVGTEIQRINRTKTEYLVLEPLDKAESRFYIPTGNAFALAKIKPVLTSDEMQKMLLSAEIHSGTWIPEENRRKQFYRELVSGGDRVSLLKMLVLLYRHREQQLATGRKFHQCDDNFMRDAEKLLCSEIMLVMNLSSSEAKAYLREQLKCE